MSQLEPNIAQLVWFTLLWSVCCLGFFQLAGMYPLASRAAKIPASLVIVSTALWIVLLISALTFAVTELRWTSTIIVAGMLFLFTPEPFQAIPERWRNSSAGVLFTGLALALTLIAFCVFTPNLLTTALRSII
jgi:hypothetical protein